MSIFQPACNEILGRKYLVWRILGNRKIVASEKELGAHLQYIGITSM